MAVTRKKTAKRSQRQTRRSKAPRNVGTARRQGRSAAFVERLKSTLTEDLDKAGIRAEVSTEAVRGTRMHRVWVVSPQLAGLRFSERQEVVWRIIDNALTKDEQLLITTIWTLTPSEMAGEWAA